MDEAIAASAQTTLPAALAEPAVPVKGGWITLTRVLPAAVDGGKDAGLVNIAYTLPLVAAPLATGAVLGLVNSYQALFALAGIVTILAAWTVSRVSSAA